MTRDRSNDPRKSAAELMAELRQDPEYRDRVRRREEQQQRNAESYARAAEPVLRDLAAKGFHVRTIGELRQSKAEYRSAVTTLVHWLPRVSDSQVKEDIVRALSVPWAAPQATKVLIKEFRQAEDATGTGLRWTIASGLAAVADESVMDDLVHLVLDRQYGRSREMLALALGNVSTPQVVDVLIELLDDEQTLGHAVIALGRLKAAKAHSRLRNLTRHRIKWIREEARKALATIERGLPK